MHEDLRQAVLEKIVFSSRDGVLSTPDCVYGRRHEPYGSENSPPNCRARRLIEREVVWGAPNRTGCLSIEVPYR